MLQEIIEVLISGITSGSIYAMMALGMALVYGVTKVFNFAYGSFYTMGGYLAYVVYSSGLGHLGVFLITLPVLFAAGWWTEKLAIKPLRKRDDWEMLAVMVTLGLALFLDNLHQVIFGPFKKSIPALVEGQTHVGTFVFSNHDVTILVAALLSMLFFVLFLNKSYIGMSVRAVAQNPIGAQIVGVANNRIFAYTFALSAVLVGTAGVLLVPKYYVHPFGGWDILVKAWVITAFGGMGSLKGSFYAAFILGIVEAFVGWHFGLTWTIFAWFTVLLGTLIIRPQGLFGTWG
jgi:branched-chain amino acid transport system permease protein